MGSEGAGPWPSWLRYLRTESVAEAPPEVGSELRRRIVDTLAAMIAGHRVERLDITTAFATEIFAKGQSTVLDGSGRQRGLAGAALANGLAANALDIDDGSRKAEGHPAAVIVPAAFAAAERVNASVGSFLDAVLGSYEFAVRLAPALKSWTEMWNGSGSWGAVGAAAAVSRLMRHRAVETWHALGLAEFNAPLAPNQRAVRNPGSSMTKDGIGWGCYVGTTAAQFAAHGVTGSGTVLDATDLAASSFDSLGERYFLLENYYKPYPGCRWAHPGIDAAFELLDQHSIERESIDRVRVHTFEQAIDLGTLYPSNPDQAQYSYAYLLAVALVKGDWLTPDDLDKRVRESTSVRDMIERISFVHDQRAQDLYSCGFTARVEIDVDGETFESDLTHPRGAPERPMTEPEHRKKQSLLIDRTLGDGTAHELRNLLQEDELPVRDLLVRIGLIEA